MKGACFIVALVGAWSNRRHGVRLLRDVDYPNVYSPSRGLMRGWLLLLGVIELGLLLNALYCRLSYEGGDGFSVVYSYPELSLVENLSKFSLLAASIVAKFTEKTGA